jgi:AraC family transcriptional regulator
MLMCASTASDGSGSPTEATRRSSPAGLRRDWGDQIDPNAVLDTAHPVVHVSPAETVERRIVAWPGMTVEIIQATRRERIEYRYRAPLHLLIVHHRGARLEGVTSIEGTPRSSLRELRKRLTFVPAGQQYHEWHHPRDLNRIAFFYFDPSKVPLNAEITRRCVVPRILFEDKAVYETAFKLTSLIDNADLGNRSYLEALRIVLAHELFKPGTAGLPAPSRGGLSPWQQRTLTAYIEEHLTDHISLAALAQLIRLSPAYLCRAFKHSFGLPPHRYHTARRIEHAKNLLAKPELSVMQIGLTVGFSDASTFTAAFRRITGITPTEYRRGLA